MNRVTRRFLIEVEGRKAVKNRVTGKEEEQVVGVVTVDEWLATQSVIDSPENTGKLRFHMAPGSFGTQSVSGEGMPYVTDEEMELIRSVVEGYYYGADNKGGTIVHWSMNNAVAYQIAEEHTLRIPTDEDDRMLIFDEKEAAEKYLEEMGEDGKNLRVSKVLLSARRL